MTSECEGSQWRSCCLFQQPENKVSDELLILLMTPNRQHQMKPIRADNYCPASASPYLFDIAEITAHFSAECTGLTPDTRTGHFNRRPEHKRIKITRKVQNHDGRKEPDKIPAKFTFNCHRLTDKETTDSNKTQRNIGESGSLKIMPSGAILLDTAGMRELQLAEFDSSAIANFADIIALEKQCRFSDCRHEGEPGCALKAAVKSNRLDEQRVADFLLLRNEDNDDDQVTKSKPQEKFYRSAQSDIRARKHSSAE